MESVIARARVGASGLERMDTDARARGPVLSLHPCIEADRFYWARGVWDEGLARELQAARAVVLPQTVDRELYALCAHLCPRVFPNYDIRFQWEGKVGDALLFMACGVPHPPTRVFPRVETLVGEHRVMGQDPAVLSYPFVLKGARGGEGTQTWLIETPADLERGLRILTQLEWQGIYGFVIQEYLPGLDRDLRVVAIGDHFESYWRSGVGAFLHNVARGGEIDHDSAPELQAAGREAARRLCARTGINLAAFDLVFPPGGVGPLFLEVNYTFGRTGLGGSEAFYARLRQAVTTWLLSR